MDGWMDGFDGWMDLMDRSIVRSIDRWMDGLRFHVLFNSISVISGQWTGDNERLCAISPRLRLKRSPPQAGLEPGTATSVGKRLICRATGAHRCIGSLSRPVINLHRLKMHRL